jgi:[CysO sulfur-carrier protein]-S-L-cysteine hydrolase
MTAAEARGRLEVPADMYDELVTHAQSDWPYEVCGLLAGRDGVAERFHPIRNAERSMTAYRMDPQAMAPVYAAIDDDDDLELGIFHSHTHTEAFPSATDVADAAWNPHAVFLIVSLQDRDQPVLRAFDIVDGHVTERVLTVKGEPAATGGR